jgi:3-carboxy-cis,cis-muconate cycloisomerase
MVDEPAIVGSQGPFSLLMRLYGDPEMSACWTAERSVALWTQVEAALAQSQADLGIIAPSSAEDIASAAVQVSEASAESIWPSAANVGYPILPVVRLLDERAGRGRGTVHLGATTQDIMDSALAMQMRDATDLLIARAVRLGDLLADLTEQHASTVMAGRTHAQQAVPTTFGAKLAVFLDQVSRCIDRLAQERSQVARVSLFGAAGTSAALGEHSSELRVRLAERLGLQSADVPWHVSRDALFIQSANAIALSQVAHRLAKEVIDLSRTEVREVSEALGVHRGASSTMPQKSNPILSEAIIGFAVSASSLLPAAARMAEPGHERSAGEWQIEWQVLPELFVLVSSALAQAASLLEGLQVDASAMRENLSLDHGMLMAEAYMMALAPTLGRERAHDVVYSGCVEARRSGSDLLTVLEGVLDDKDRALMGQVAPERYLGEAHDVCARVVTSWRARSA